MNNYTRHHHSIAVGSSYIVDSDSLFYEHLYDVNVQVGDTITPTPLFPNTIPTAYARVGGFSGFGSFDAAKEWFDTHNTVPNFENLILVSGIAHFFTYLRTANEIIFDNHSTRDLSGFRFVTEVAGEVRLTREDLVTVNLNALVTVGGSFEISNTTNRHIEGTSTLLIPNLVSVGGDFIVRDVFETEPESFNVDSLTTINGNLILSNNNLPADLNFTNLTIVDGYIDLMDCGINSLAHFSRNLNNHLFRFDENSLDTSFNANDFGCFLDIVILSHNLNDLYPRLIQEYNDLYPTGNPDCLESEPINNIMFNDIDNLSVDTVVTSNTVVYRAFRGSLPISIITDANNLEINISGEGWVSVDSDLRDIVHADSVTIRATTSAAREISNTTTVNVGNTSISWSIRTENSDRTPNAFRFNSITTTERDTLVISNTVRVTGIDDLTPTAFSISGDTNLIEISMDSESDWVLASDISINTISDNTPLRLRATSPSTRGHNINLTITVGTYSTSWFVSTARLDIYPNAFEFSDISNVEPGSQLVSNTITVNGVNDPVRVLITGGAEFSINGAAWQQESEVVFVSNGDTVSLRTNATSTRGSKTISNRIGVRSGSPWIISTIPLDDSPAVINFDRIYRAQLNVYVESNIAIVTGINESVDVRVFNSDAQYRINSGPWRSNGVVSSITSGDTIQMRFLTGSRRNADTNIDILIGTVRHPWYICTVRNTAPYVANRISDMTILVNDFIAIDLSSVFFSDDPEDVITITGVSGLPSWLALHGDTIATQSIAGQTLDLEQSNTHQITIHVQDSYGSRSSETFILEVYPDHTFTINQMNSALDCVEIN